MENEIYASRELIVLIKNTIRIYKKNNKKKFIKYSKSVKTNLENKIEEMKIDINSGNNTSNLLSNVLGYVLQTKSTFFIKTDNVIDIEQIKKDKSFMVFYKNIVIVENIIKENEYKKEFLELYNMFFGDIRSIVMSYFLITENNITDTKLMNTLSYFFKNSKIEIIFSQVSEDVEERINQITSGIKYEKEKPVNNNDYEGKRNYKKLNKFDILQYLSTRITIKYISKKEYKHMFHKRPIEHKRRGHWRSLKNGNSIWIEEKIINEGMVS